MIVEIWYAHNLADREHDTPRAKVAEQQIEIESAEFDLTDEGMLEIVWGMWNNGSGSECTEFLNAKLRSMSVSDVVCLRNDNRTNPRFYYCAPFGWERVERP